MCIDHLNLLGQRVEAESDPRRHQHQSGDSLRGVGTEIGLVRVLHVMIMRMGYACNAIRRPRVKVFVVRVTMRGGRLLRKKVIFITGLHVVCV
jgi:hypothetical protein